MADPTPEERVMAVLQYTHFASRFDHDTSIKTMIDQVEAAEAAAFKRGLEAGAKVCHDIWIARKALVHDAILGAAFTGEAAGAHQCMEAIRERAKEAPRGS